MDLALKNRGIASHFTLIFTCISNSLPNPSAKTNSSACIGSRLRTSIISSFNATVGFCPIDSAGPPTTLRLVYMPTAVCSQMGRYGYVVITRSLSTKVWLRTNTHYHGPMTSTSAWQEESHSRSLDLIHAYLQLTLDEGSRDYVTINTHKGLFG